MPDLPARVFSLFVRRPRILTAAPTVTGWLHHRSLKAQLICLDFPARRNKFPGDQLSIPSKQRVWRHQGFEFEKPFSADRFGLHREPTALLIGESQSLSAELVVQRSILLL